MTYAKRTDANHRIVLEALRACGWHCEDTSRSGRGFPDLVCGKGGRLVLIEIKDGDKAPSKQQLTKDEARVHAAFLQAGCPVQIVRSVDEAVTL